MDFLLCTGKGTAVVEYATVGLNAFVIIPLGTHRSGNFSCHIAGCLM